MKYITDYRLEHFILNTCWEDLPPHVKPRAVACFIDLIGALIIGSRSNQFNVGLLLSSKVFGKGNVAVIGSDLCFSFAGATAAMSHASNAYDIDDGHNIIRAHPGTSFIGGLLAAAYEKDIRYKEFLTALTVSYEATVRFGRAAMDYYNFAHSSGTFGAFGTAAGVGRLYGFSAEMLNNALSIADFNAPIVPGIRSVEYPSMNKDGVPFGAMTGALAIEETLCGFTGNKNLLESADYSHYTSDLGENYEIMSLYFKPYTCCRWAHPAIDACLSLMQKYNFRYTEIKSVTIQTFKQATMLSKIVPKTEDEAQYNIAYPVASAIVNGDFGFAQVSKTGLLDLRVLEMMERLSFEVDNCIDAQFPQKRICRAEITLNNGSIFISDECQPRGESCDNIGIDWIKNKFCRIAGSVMTAKATNEILSLLCADTDCSMRTIVDFINRKENLGTL